MRHQGDAVRPGGHLLHSSEETSLSGWFKEETWLGCS